MSNKEEVFQEEIFDSMFDDFEAIHNAKKSTEWKIDEIDILCWEVKDKEGIFFPPYSTAVLYFKNRDLDILMGITRLIERYQARLVAEGYQSNRNNALNVAKLIFESRLKKEKFQRENPELNLKLFYFDEWEKQFSPNEFKLIYHYFLIIDREYMKRYFTEFTA